jgi:hypothetical protein
MAKMNKLSKTQLHKIDRTDALLAVVLGIVWMALYIRTLAPGLLPGDSGEFQILAYLLGHAHTTSYDVYLLLAKMFTILPFGDIAYRVNLFSAVTAASTLSAVYLIGQLVWDNRCGAMIGATALGVSAIFWSQAVIAEVYTPAALFTSVITLFCLLWYRSNKGKYLFTAGLLGGLSIGVHANVSLLAPAILVLILITKPKGSKTWISALGGTLLGLVLAICAFVIVDGNSGTHDAINVIYRPAISKWDMVPDDLDSAIGRFKFLYTATQWRPAMFSDPMKVMPEQALNYLGKLPANFSWVSLALFLIGLIYAFVHDHRVGIFLTLGMLSINIFTFNYAIGDIHVFYIPSYFFIAIFIAGGVTYLASIMSKLRLSKNPALRIALCLVILLGTVYPFIRTRIDYIKESEASFPFTNMPSKVQASTWQTNLYAMVQELEEDAIVFSHWNDLFPLIYLARVDSRRDDLYFVEGTPYSQNPGLADSTLDFILQNIDSRPIYANFQLPGLEAAGLQNYTTYIGTNRLYKIRR